MLLYACRSCRFWICERNCGIPHIRKKIQNKNCNPDVRRPNRRFASSNTADKACVFEKKSIIIFSCKSEKNVQKKTQVILLTNVAILIEGV